MTKPLTSGVGLYRSTLPQPVTNYSQLYGWVEETGPFNANERWRGEIRLKTIGYPRAAFTPQEIDQAAGEVRALGLADVRRERLERLERANQALGERAVGFGLAAMGLGGIVFYLWMGWVMLRESPLPESKLPRAGWFGRRRRHRLVTFGRIAA
jgi:hypothetical protein